MKKCYIYRDVILNENDFGKSTKPESMDDAFLEIPIDFEKEFQKSEQEGSLNS